MDVSGAVELYVNRQAKEIAPIRLTGNYGSEILRSNIAFGPGRLDISLFTPEFARLLVEAIETYRQEATENRLSFIAFKQVAWHHFSRLSVEKSQLTLRSPFLDNELVALAYQAPAEMAFSPAPLLQLIAAGSSELSSVKTDRALRYEGIPALGRIAKAWQELTAKAEYAYDYGMPQWLAKIDHLFAHLHLEKLFLGRHKFYHFRIWYPDRVEATSKQAYLPARAILLSWRGAPNRIVATVICRGRSNRTLMLHKMLTLQLIESLLVRQNEPRHPVWLFDPDDLAHQERHRSEGRPFRRALDSDALGRNSGFTACLSLAGFGGSVDTLEGSPLDRLFFFGMIFAALIVVSRRALSWQLVISRNWPLFLFYGFLLVSVLWANSPEASFKRWFKDFGNIVVLLVMLTEVNTPPAFRAVSCPVWLCFDTLIHCIHTLFP